MTLPLTAETFPLEADSQGVFKVGGTRVTLDTLVYAFLDGATAEEIAFRYPSLELADVYATITYYLRHRESVDRYLRSREVRAVEVRLENESRFDPIGIRERLLARRVGP